MMSRSDYFNLRESYPIIVFRLDFVVAKMLIPLVVVDLCHLSKVCTHEGHGTRSPPDFTNSMPHPN